MKPPTDLGLVRRNLANVLGEESSWCPHARTVPAHFCSKADLGHIWVPRPPLLSEREEEKTEGIRDACADTPRALATSCCSGTTWTLRLSRPPAALLATRDCCSLLRALPELTPLLGKLRRREASTQGSFDGQSVPPPAQARLSVPFWAVA